jgi:hypothetical protein
MRLPAALACFLILAGCSARWVPVEEVCSPDPVTEPIQAAVGGQDVPWIAGRYFDASSGRPIDGVRLVVTEAGARADTSFAERDSFVVRLSEPGVVVLQATQLGYYERADTVTVPEGSALRLALPLHARAMDACGMPAVRRKPWWHMGF